MFASLHSADLVCELEKISNIKIDPAWLLLDKPIKTVGSYSVKIKTGQIDDAVLFEVVGG